MGSGARVVGEAFQEEISGGVRDAQRGWGGDMVGTGVVTWLALGW